MKTVLVASKEKTAKENYPKLHVKSYLYGTLLAETVAS